MILDFRNGRIPSFIVTVEGKEGPAVWLAKRGISLVALNRVGRWNFLAPTNDGFWESVPLEKRMPIYERNQKSHWTAPATLMREYHASVRKSAIPRYVI